MNIFGWMQIQRRLPLSFSSEWADMANPNVTWPDWIIRHSSRLNLQWDLQEIPRLVRVECHTPLMESTWGLGFQLETSFFQPRIIVASSPLCFQRYCPSRSLWGEFCCSVWSALRGPEPWERWPGAGPKSPRRRYHPERRSLRGWSPCGHRWNCTGSNLEEGRQWWD